MSGVVPSSQGDVADVDKKRASGFLAAKEGWLKQCARYPNLSGSDLAVAIALSTYLNSKSHMAWPAMETLAIDTGRNRSTVWRAVARLERMGLIEVVHGRGRKKSNRYRPKLGHMEVDPKSLRRKTTLRGKTLRVRNDKTANSQQKRCEPAARTLEEEQKNLGTVEFKASTSLESQLLRSPMLS